MILYSGQSLRPAEDLGEKSHCQKEAWFLHLFFQSLHPWYRVSKWSRGLAGQIAKPTLAAAPAQGQPWECQPLRAAGHRPATLPLHILQTLPTLLSPTPQSSLLLQQPRERARFCRVQFIFFLQIMFRAGWQRSMPLLRTSDQRGNEKRCFQYTTAVTISVQLCLPHLDPRQLPHSVCGRHWWVEFY